MSDLQDFIDGLYKSGWTCPNDAQWENISKFYEEFCIEKENLEQQLKTCQSELEKLRSKNDNPK